MTQLDLDTLFGDVRAVLDGAPSAERWDRLCEVLAPTSPSPALEERLVPYVESCLANWPDPFRRAPSSWLIQRKLKARAHLLPLCRAVDITRASLTHRGLARILDSWGDRPITHLDLEDSHGISDDGCVTLAASSHASTITHLNLNLCRIHEQGFRALSALTGPFDFLDLSFNSAKNGALGPWLSTRAFANARVVLLDHCDLTSHDLFALCDQVGRGEHIQRLELRGSDLSNDHAFALTRIPWPDSLEILDLRDIHASPRALEHLESAPHLEGIIKL